MTTSERERQLREKLGIPDHVERVLMFSESSHWDTNWLRTSEEYFEQRLRPILETRFDGLFAAGRDGFTPRWVTPGREILITWQLKAESRAQ